MSEFQPLGSHDRIGEVACDRIVQLGCDKPALPHHRTTSINIRLPGTVTLTAQ